jgi:hypothetical protein
MTLLEKIEAHLLESGYTRTDDPAYWSPPDDDWVDKLFPTIQDCLERESV